MIAVEANGTNLPAEGEAFLVRIRNPRNPKHHNLYWAMVTKVVESTGHWPSKRALHRWLKYQLGYYTVRAVDDGRVVLEWDSTDFMSMDQHDFNEFFEQAVAAICLETGIDPLNFTQE